MSQALMSTDEEVGNNATERVPHPSLMTPLGVVEGEVLTFLDRQRGATLRQLNHTLQWPAYMVMMAVGALIRAGLVRGIQHDLEVMLTLRKPLGARQEGLA